MSYEQLKEKVRRRDVEAAQALEPLARAQGDSKSVLSCWRLLIPERAKAWQALRATFNSLGPMPKTDDPRESGETAVVQRAVVAQLLVDRCRLENYTDPLAVEMLDVATLFLERGSSFGLDEELSSVPLAEDEAGSMVRLEAIRAVLELR